jgi:F0F1-type ATP synthase assembly protein I
MDAQRDDRSLGQLFGDLSRQLGTLVQQEIALAKTEVTSRVTTVSRDAAMLGAGAALGYAALLVGLITIGLILIELGLEPWIAFLVVTLVVGAIAGFLIQRGRAQLKEADLAPRETIQTIKDDAAWAKERVK